MNRRAAVVVAVALAAASPASYAEELKLFDVELRSATAAEFHAAAVKGGARLIRTSGTHRVYDAKRVGLPGATTLDVLFDDEHFIIAMYSFDRNSAHEYELRRLLVAKYGAAHLLLSSGKRVEVDIGTRYPGRGVYRWSFEAPLELIYNNIVEPGMGVSYDSRLTYVDRPRFEALQRQEADSQKQRDKLSAERLKGAF